jgi:uncharacterized protein (TIGR03437 family)
MTFPVVLSPANEVPPIAGLEASAPSTVTVHTLRNEDGTVAAGHVVFDVNHRFPGETTFTGLHVHDGLSTATGPVRLDSGITGAAPTVSSTGFGNIYLKATMLDATSLATLNSVVGDPTRHYLNLHTTVNGGGAVRAQLGAPRTGRPAIGAIVNAVNDAALTTGAPGGLLSFYGSNFAAVTTDLSGWEGRSLPRTLNGLSISVEGSNDRLPLFFVSPTQVTAQLPFGIAAGARQITVNVADGEASLPRALTVAETAPGIFTYESGGIVVRNSDFSLIGPGNPARIGDVVVVYATGLGQTTPALETGAFASADPLARTGTVTATIGGRPAEVIYSLASPGFVGLYQVALRVAQGTTTGNNVPLVLTIGGRNSNSVGIAVQ